MSLRAHAARIIARVPADLDDEIRLTDGRIEVIVIVRPCTASAPPTPQPTLTDSRLSDTDRTVLGVLCSEWKKARTIAIDAGFAPQTASVRISLAKLVRLGLALNERGRGYRLA